MKNKIFSQEGLKFIACITMLIDHIGAVFFPQMMFLRLIGRLSFPIFCFLLVEGAHYTKNAKRYAYRLAAGVLLSEIPFDLAFYGGLTLRHQSVMVTLLLGYMTLLVMQRCKNFASKACAVIPFALLAELTCSDYGGYGVLLISLFSITREVPYLKKLLQTVGMYFTFRDIPCLTVSLFGYEVPSQMFAVFAMVPISLYSAEKVTTGKAIQRVFYLFYPTHLLFLFFLQQVI